ncbi:MAG TPA: hypothetical protein VJ943_16175 [Desulfotignum sp.]|nr:hypothetical protein [Desulfotignum sp.]
MSLELPFLQQYHIIPDKKKGCIVSMVQHRSWTATEIQTLLPGVKPFKHGFAQAGEKPAISWICRVIGMKIIRVLFSFRCQMILTRHKDKTAIWAYQIDPVLIFKIQLWIIPSAQGATIV